MADADDDPPTGRLEGKEKNTEPRTAGKSEDSISPQYGLEQPNAAATGLTLSPLLASYMLHSFGGMQK